MQTTGNTLLITGGGTGIGRGLAAAFHALGNQVVISGRTPSTLAEATAAHPGMRSLIVDMTDTESLRGFADRLLSDFPKLNGVILNAGIMRPENLLEEDLDSADAEEMVATNLLGPIRLLAHLLPRLRRQPRATVMTVTSGLAFLPLAMTPTYCATKAAMHSYSESLRYQLAGSSVQVLELAPPYVQTTLMGDHQASDPRAMPLTEYIAEVMQILTQRPEATEILVERVKPLRWAAAAGEAGYAKQFKAFNDAQVTRH